MAFGSNLGDVATSSISLGIVVGLVLGKPIGIILATILMVRSGLADLPSGVSWRYVAGASCLAGIGFTMSLFVADLAFLDPEQVAAAKIGILAGSIIAATLGAAVLSPGHHPAPQPEHQRPPAPSSHQSPA